MFMFVSVFISYFFVWWLLDSTVTYDFFRGTCLIVCYIYKIFVAIQDINKFFSDQQTK